MSDWLDLPVYDFNQKQKRDWMVPFLNQLSTYHSQHCKAYQQLKKKLPQFPGQGLEQETPVHIQLFKTLKMASIDSEQVFKTLHSSGTRGQASTILLDRTTARLQNQALVKIMQHWLGKQRLPMLIIDHPQVNQDRDTFHARAAGIKGLSFLGRDYCYALDTQMHLNMPAIEAFAKQHQGQKVLIFGFTFMVWHYFLRVLMEQAHSLPFAQAILLHSGGWKKLIAEQVSDAIFADTCKKYLGCTKIHNFYGLAEQTGSIFVACEQGYLHCPIFSDVIIRDPHTFAPLHRHQPGVIQLCSVLPQSYPGHLLLTEDQGVLIGEDDCPCQRKGRYFRVLGRLPEAKPRGCSDTFRELTDA